MKYNNTLYYYVLNAQGDVIALADQNGNLIAKYSYDPWGKLLSVTPNGWLDEQNAYYLEVAEANRSAIAVIITTLKPASIISSLAITTPRSAAS